MNRPTQKAAALVPAPQMEVSAHTGAIPKTNPYAQPNPLMRPCPMGQPAAMQHVRAPIEAPFQRASQCDPRNPTLPTGDRSAPGAPCYGPDMLSQVQCRPGQTMMTGIPIASPPQTKAAPQWIPPPPKSMPAISHPQMGHLRPMPASMHMRGPPLATSHMIQWVPVVVPVEGHGPCPVGSPTNRDSHLQTMAREAARPPGTVCHKADSASYNPHPQQHGSNKGLAPPPQSGFQQESGQIMPISTVQLSPHYLQGVLPPQQPRHYWAPASLGAPNASSSSPAAQQPPTPASPKEPMICTNLKPTPLSGGAPPRMETGGVISRGTKAHVRAGSMQEKQGLDAQEHTGLMFPLPSTSYLRQRASSEASHTTARDEGAGPCGPSP